MKWSQTKNNIPLQKDEITAAEAVIKWYLPIKAEIPHIYERILSQVLAVGSSDLSEDKVIIDNKPTQEERYMLACEHNRVLQSAEEAVKTIEAALTRLTLNETRVFKLLCAGSTLPPEDYRVKKKIFRKIALRILGAYPAVVIVRNYIKQKNES